MSALLLSLLVITGVSVDSRIPVNQLTDSQVIEQDISGASVRISDGLPGAAGGFPDLPVIPWTVELPAGYRAVSVRILEEQWLDVSTDIYIRPLPDPLPLVLEDTFAAPDPAVYDRSEYWPASPVRLSGTGYRDGHPVAGILVSPYRFSPATGSLQKLVDLRISMLRGC